MNQQFEVITNCRRKRLTIVRMSVTYDTDSSDEPDHRLSVDSKVTIDAWQNQRFKPLQGGRTMPFVDIGVPYFSDLSGTRKIEFETDEEDGEVVPLVELISFHTEFPCLLGAYQLSGNCKVLWFDKSCVIPIVEDRIVHQVCLY